MPGYTYICTWYEPTSRMRMEDALLCTEIVINIHLKFHMPLWILSMDIRKASDTIEYDVLMEATCSRNLPEDYVALLFLLSTNHKASANHSSEFPVRRRVNKTIP